MGAMVAEIRRAEEDRVIRLAGMEIRLMVVVSQVEVSRQAVHGVE